MTHAIAKYASRTRSRKPNGMVMTTTVKPSQVFCHGPESTSLLLDTSDPVLYYEIAKIRKGLLIETQSGYAYVFPEVAGQQDRRQDRA
jgi:hypothetical protein